MTFKEQILAFLRAHPGATLLDLHQQFDAFSFYSVERNVLALCGEQQLYRVLEVSTKTYRYAMKGMEIKPRAPMPRQLERQQLEEQVDGLVKRGFNRRAGELCLALIDTSDTDAQRQRYAAMRGRLLRSTGKHSQEWFLAGNWVG